MGNQDQPDENITTILPSREEASTKAMLSFAVDTVVNNRYRIERELGRGGFGIVYLARDQQLHGKRVVIKIRDEKTDGTGWLEKKFRQESEALARIAHPGVVGVLEQGETPDGRLYLVMEYVDGATLRSVLKHGLMDLKRAGELMCQIAQALSAAHSQGVYHRDLKPENIMIRTLGGGRELAVIIDFGIATVTDSSVASSHLTKVAGSLSYMAPEQLSGHPGEFSDVYSLGVIGYEMVTGRHPFHAASPVELFFQQKEGLKQKPADLRPELPPAAENAILKALSYDPGGRYAQAQEFGEELSKAIQENASSAPPLTRARSAVHTGQKEHAMAMQLELASVLFMDIVAYSVQPIDRQINELEELQQIVRSTAEFRQAQARDELICLPTGDGMALVFFRDPIAPVQCAMEVCRALKSHPSIKLRMGVNTGPVYKIADINANRNVAGGGINMAQRVMDCGDAGHILISRSVAEVLNQLSDWPPYLHDLGEHSVKQGARIQLFNLCRDDVGNRELPAKLQAAALAQTSVNAPGAQQRRRGFPWRWLALAAIMAVLAAGWVMAVRFRTVNPPSTPNASLPVVPERTLSFYLMVQKSGNSKPFQLGKEILFDAGNRVQLALSSPEQGHLYLLNEGPIPKNGLPDFNTLFPSPTSNDGSSWLPPNREVRIPPGKGFLFDKEEGTEKLWMIWSAKTLPEFEALKKWTESAHGSINDPAQLDMIRGFLKNHPVATAQVDLDAKLTKLNQRADPLVYLLRLEHH